MLCKKYCSIILLLLSVFTAKGQNTSKNHFNVKVIYKVSFVGDSTVRNKRFVEDAFLFINTENNSSWFESSKSFDNKSVKNSLGKTYDRSIEGFRNLTWTISKRGDSIICFDSYSIMIDNKEANTQYHYLENLNDMLWEIKADTMTYNNYLCQKAIIHFGNREWIAWFTSEIPINEGPYKFKNLPGLIVNLYDKQQDWNFEITSIQKVANDFYLDVNLYKNYQAVDKQWFLKNKRYYESNYLQIREASGDSFIDPENRKIMQENINLNFKSRSNWIELYP